MIPFTGHYERFRRRARPAPVMDHCERQRWNDNGLFAVETHTTMAVTGVSGCGKTTLLRTIAGLIVAERGRVMLGPENIDSWAPNRRGIVYLNQEPLLFPHLSICAVTGLALDEENRWSLDLDLLKAAVRPNTKVISINFPNNPTGAITPR